MTPCVLRFSKKEAHYSDFHAICKIFLLCMKTWLVICLVYPLIHYHKVVEKKGIFMDRQKNLVVIGANLGWGAQNTGTELGPKALQDFQLIQQLVDNHLKVSWIADIYSSESALSANKKDFDDRVQLVATFNQKLATTIKGALHQEYFPIVLGGDHSIAIGTWSGITHFYQAEQNFGLIWLDAHMDGHTAQTTPSKAIHGMPIAALLGHGENSLTQIESNQAKINPQHIVLIGVRSYEEGEKALLQKSGVKIFDMEAIRDRGFAYCFEQALSQVSANTKGFGLSIDLDFFDPQVAPGVGTPEPKGPLREEVLHVLQGLGHNEQFKALEIVEYNPACDQEDKTAKLVRDIIKGIFHE